MKVVYTIWHLSALQAAGNRQERVRSLAGAALHSKESRTAQRARKNRRRPSSRWTPATKWSFVFCLSVQLSSGTPLPRPGTCRCCPAGARRSPLQLPRGARLLRLRHHACPAGTPASRLLIHLPGFGPAPRRRTRVREPEFWQRVEEELQVLGEARGRVGWALRLRYPYSRVTQDLTLLPA